MGHKINCCGGFGFILSHACAGVLAAAVATTYWRTPGSNTINAIVTLHTLPNAIGLFEECVTFNDVTTCTDIGLSPSEAGLTVTVTRGILLVGAIMLVIGLLVGLIAICGGTDITKQGSLNIVASLFILVACAVYTAMTVYVEQSVPNPPAATDYGYSYYMCWSTGVVTFMAGLCCLNGKRRDNDVQPIAVQRAQVVWATTGVPQQSVVSSQGQQRLALIA